MYFNDFTLFVVGSAASRFGWRNWNIQKCHYSRLSETVESRLIRKWSTKNNHNEYPFFCVPENHRPIYAIA